MLTRLEYLKLINATNKLLVDDRDRFASVEVPLDALDNPPTKLNRLVRLSDGGISTYIQVLREIAASTGNKNN